MKTAKRKPLHAVIRDHVADRIRSGYWRRGDRLPSENELAARFGVSRITAKIAMSRLAEEGMIYRVQGKGSFVGPAFEPAADVPASGAPASGVPAVDAQAADAPAGRSGIPQPWAAFLVPSLDAGYTVNLLKGIEDAFRKAGVRLVLCLTDGSPARERQLIEEMVASGANGLIVYPSEGEAYNEELVRLTIDRYPLVVIDRYLKGLETNCVCSDHFAGARLAVSVLLREGHRRIAFLSPPVDGTTSLEERLEGYRQALSDAMLPLDARLVVKGDRQEKLAQFFRENGDVTAVFAANAGMGLRAMDALDEADLRVPGDVSLIIFDTYDHASYFRVPPTCIVQQEKEIGREAAKLLFSVMRDPNRERRKIVLPPRLAAGRSVAPPRPGRREG